MILVGTITVRASAVLNDTVHTRWPVDELLTWINEGAKAIVTRRPDAGASTELFTLVDGSRQTLPDDAFRLVDVCRNMGSNGTTTGRVIKRVDRQLMDNADPDWHTRTPGAVTRSYMYDWEINPREFYVYPPAVAAQKVELTISRLPAEITDEQDQIELPAEFEEALLSYVLFRSFSKDSEYANAQTAAAHYAAFVAALGQQQAAAE